MYGSPLLMLISKNNKFSDAVLIVKIIKQLVTGMYIFLKTYSKTNIKNKIIINDKNYFNTISQPNNQNIHINKDNSENHYTYMYVFALFLLLLFRE